MLKRTHILKIALLVLMLCTYSSFSQEIVVDVSQSLGAQISKIKANTDTEELPDLILKLTNIDPNDDETKYTFSGNNFADPSNLIDQSKGYDSGKNEVTFALADLIKFTPTPNDGNYVYKLTYSGANKGAVFGAANDLTLSLKVVKVDEETEEEVSFSASEIQEAAIDYVKNDTEFEKYYSSKTNLFLKDNIVHIYIDENGNFIETSLPTTAKENYVYQFHLLVEKNNLDKADYSFTYDGKFQPKFNIQKTKEQGEIIKLNSESQSQDEPEIIELPFSRIGPFTEEFSVKLVKKEGDTSSELINSKVTVAKLYHVTISTGLFASTLRNPTDIEKVALVSGDSTLVASDPNSRGILTIMATYYPSGRSFLFPPSGGLFDPSRFGIQVGTQLNDKLAENFFGGISIDFARGGSFSTGIHYGRRSYIAGKDDFDFGEEVFDLPELTIKQEWQLGWYFGVTIDTRVAIELISSLASGN